jgi:hypothetical protein
MLTKAQYQALKSYAADLEAPDYAEYADRAGSALGWLNRERVISALIRKGMIDADQHITPEGKQALERIPS